eukprot:jgi/Ulvmu1/3058/UM015_0098.1
MSGFQRADRVDTVKFRHQNHVPDITSLQVQGHGGASNTTGHTVDDKEGAQDAGKGILVSPLVMQRQPFRSGMAGHIERNTSSHAYEARRKAYIATSAIFHGLSPLPTDQLPPKPPGRIRPQSAQPVTRGNLHLSSGNYTGIAAVHYAEGGIRLPQFGEPAPVSTLPCVGLPATLVASQLMQSATPAGVHTGEDAVHYFSINKHQSTGSLFIFCNFRRADPSTHDPYSLIVVDRRAVAPEHCVVSCTGVCHIQPNAGNTVSPLHKWAAEARQFRTLKQLTFFKKFVMVKAWANWKVEHQTGKFSRRVTFLETQHLMLNAWFGETMRACHCLAMSVTSGSTGTWQRVGATWHVSTLASGLKEVCDENIPVTKENLLSGALNLPLRLAFLGREGCCHKMKEFQKIRTEMRDSVSAAMDTMAAEIASLVHILAVDVQQEMEDAYPAELKHTALRKITTQRPSPLARLRARSLLVKKFVKLTTLQRFDHAKIHAALMSRALRLADMLVMGAMLDLARTSVNLAMRQLLRDNVTLCHLDQPVQYKYGLWIVAGEIIPMKRRLNMRSVLKMNPSNAELCSHAAAVLREIVGVAAATTRPLEREHLIQHHLSLMPQSNPEPPLLLAFGSVFKRLCDVESLQESITRLIESDYEAFRVSEAMTAFTNVGELFTFMEAFDPDTYLTANPTCEEVCQDFGILQNWIADLQGLHPTLQKGLLLFDLSSLRSAILETAEATMRSFVKLTYGWLYDNCIRVRATVLSAIDGIGQGSPPDDLSEFTAWVNRNGDHFAGSQSARKRLMQSVESLRHMHCQLAQVQSLIRRKDCAASRSAREMQSLTAALEAFDGMAAVLQLYSDRCDQASIWYQERVPIIEAKVCTRIKEIWGELQKVMGLARSKSGVASASGDPQAMQQRALQMRAELSERVGDAAALEKIQELLASEGHQDSSSTSLTGRVRQCTRHLESLKQLWNSIALWNRVANMFSTATLLTSRIKVATLTRALSDLDTAICSWEERPVTDDILDVDGTTDDERALVDRLRAIHTAWRQGSEVLPQLLSPAFQARHRGQLESELRGLRSTLEGSNRPIDLFLWLGDPPDQATALALLDQGDADADEAPAPDAKGKPAAMHAVTFATALVNAANVKTSILSLSTFIGPPLELDDTRLASALQSTALWRITSLLAMSGAAMAVFKRLYTASSEDSKVLDKLTHLRQRISNLRLVLSVRRQYGCLLITNLAEIIFTVDEASNATASLLSSPSVSAQLRSEFSEAEAQLSAYKSALLGADETQTLWLHLSRILAEEAAQKIVESDMPAFHEVQTRWRVMQVQIADGADLLEDASAMAGPLSHCPGMLQVLQRIYNRLLRSTSAMRDSFPRFHLCSDAEVVSALAFARDPLQLPASMLSACFPGVVALVTNDNTTGETLCVTALKGTNDDTLQLLEPIAVDQAPLAEWLAHLEVATKAGLRTHTAAALKLASEMNPGMWRSAFPQQAMYLCDGCTFTFTVERALAAVASGDSLHALRTCSEMMTVRVESLTQQLAAAEEPHRPGLRMLVLAAVAHRDTMAQLLAERAADPAAWAWQREIRHSWDLESNECYVSVADVRVPYMWEYSGGRISEVSLLLAHCDRTAAVAGAALHRDAGLQLIPASMYGTGAPIPCYAEAMSHVFGRFLISVECVPKLGFLEVLRVVQGMIAMNAWGLLSNISLLSHDVLSFLSGVVTQLQAALAAHKESTTIANVTFNLRHHPVFLDYNVQPFALFFTSPCAACRKQEISVEGRAFDDFIATHSRRVVLMAAPMSLMLEALLRQQGLRQASEASRSTVAFLRMLQMQTPDFSRSHSFESCLGFLAKYVRSFCRDNHLASAPVCIREACDALIAQFMSEEMEESAREILVEAFGPELRPSQFILARSPASSLIRERFDVLCTHTLDQEQGSGLQRGMRAGPRWLAALRGSARPDRSLKLSLALDEADITAKDVIDDDSLHLFNAEATMEIFEQLEDLVTTHQCILIVGPPGSGKTSTWTLLMKALQQAHLMRNDAVPLTPEDILTSHHIHLNSLSLREVLGSSGAPLDKNSRGILGRLLHPTEPQIHARTAAAVAANPNNSSRRPPQSPAGNLWLVIDCALQGGHADGLVPLLLGQAVWCHDGTRARVHGGQRLLWECTNLKEASPLILSSVGVCAVPPTLIDAYAVIDAVQDTALATCPLLKLVRLDVLLRIPVNMHTVPDCDAQCVGACRTL